MNQYRPDRWVILNITSETDPPVRKVFAGWTGGYLDGDSWKASSGITETLEFDDRYEFINYSGSKYICYKRAHGMTGYMGAVYNGWMNAIKDDAKIEIEPYDDLTNTSK